MKKNKKLKINLRQAIGISLSSILLLLLFLSLKWADYQKTFELNEPIILGHKILDKKDYKRKSKHPKNWEIDGNEY